MEPDGVTLAGRAVGAALFYPVLAGTLSLAARARDPSIRTSWARRLRRRHSRSTAVGPPHVARDVSGAVRARRAQSRRASSGRIVAAMAGAIALVGSAHGYSSWLLFLPAGGCLGLILPRLLSRLRRGDTRIPVRRPRRLRLASLRLSAAPVWLLSVGAGLLGLACLGELLVLDAGPGIKAATARKYGTTAKTYEDTIRAMFFVCVLIAAAGHRYARKLPQRNAREEMAKDRRAPCLLLRSFVDDGLKLFSSRSPRHAFLERVGVRRTERFEELLAWTLQAYGPVIAVAEPNRRSRTLGAAREQIDDPDWLTVVTAYLTASAHIVVVAGRTQGLKEEIQTIRRLHLLDRTLFVVPPVPARDASQRWDHVAYALDTDISLDTGDVETVLITIRDGAGVLYQGLRRDDVTYETAIDVAMSMANSAPIALQR